jgi:hypothetical protein
VCIFAIRWFETKPRVTDPSLRSQAFPPTPGETTMAQVLMERRTNSIGQAPTSHHVYAPGDAALRSAGAVALVGVALIHFLDVFDKFKETPYLGVLYLGSIAGSLVAAALLTRPDARPGWALGGGVAALTFLGYVLSRTTGLPLSHGDVGNWLEPLGLASLFVEGLVVVISGWALSAGRATGARRLTTN